MRVKWNTGNPPEEEEEYLVTTAGGNLYVADWVNTEIFGGGAGVWHWVSDSMFLKVMAWMPLPEPYKGE